MTTSVSQFEFHEQHASQADSRLWAFDDDLGGAGIRAARRARPWQRRSIERRTQPAEVGQVEAARLDIAPKAKMLAGDVQQLCLPLPVDLGRGAPPPDAQRAFRDQIPMFPEIVFVRQRAV